jgi:hypothetical protein
MSDDVEGHPGLTTVLYNKKAVKVTPLTLSTHWNPLQI